jgi:hypothetical protein
MLSPNSPPLPWLPGKSRRGRPRVHPPPRPTGTRPQWQPGPPSAGRDRWQEARGTREEWDRCSAGQSIFIRAGYNLCPVVHCAVAQALPFYTHTISPPVAAPRSTSP